MNIVEGYLKKPYLVMTFILMVAILGIFGYHRMDWALFPDSNRPQIAVVTVEPGASSRDVADNVTRPIEKELSTIDGLRQVTSTSKDEVSVVLAEFEYSKGLEPAATDVIAELQKVKPLLPRDIREPQVFKISDATAPTMTLAVFPRKGSHYDLAMVRELADNEIKEALLRLPNVANVEVFGGYQREVEILVNPDKLHRYHLTLADVIAAVKHENLNIPNGLMVNRHHQYLIKTSGEYFAIDRIGNIILGRGGKEPIHLRDVAVIKRGYKERTSAYHGNGKPAIALNILRSYGGNTLKTIESVKKYIPTLRKQYPGLDFKITDTQERIINLSIKNMMGALRDAIILTVITIFLFLGDFKGAVITGISIPFTYVMTFALMWLLGFEFNIVTLTAVIVAVGMLVDDAIVVIENIERHYHEVEQPLRQAVLDGTNEVMLAVFAGTGTNVMVLFPILFIGGYVQTVLRPFCASLIVALISSYFVSITLIPLVAPYILGGKQHRIERWIKSASDAVVHPIQDFFIGILKVGLRHKFIFLLVGAIAFVISARQMKTTIGRNLMPPMDTGIVKVAFEVENNRSLASTEKILSHIEAGIMKIPGVLSVSSTLGSEPGVVSFGRGKNPQQGAITINMIDRFHRKKTIWQIEDEIRKESHQIEGLKYLHAYDFGATPLSTILAPVDVMISGPDARVLDKLGEEAYKRLSTVPGFTSLSRTWDRNKTEIQLIVDPLKARYYGLDPFTISQQVGAALRGIPASIFRVPNEDGMIMRVRYPYADRSELSRLNQMYITTPKGDLIPLKLVAHFRKAHVQSLITHHNLLNVVDINAYRAKAPITFLHSGVVKALKGLPLPDGYKIHYEGAVKQMNESFGRLGMSMVIAIFLLYLS
ncbi:MAG: AcrB/AcrD/AcrF family protein, partial [Deltaproteobacteria bacterium]